MGGAGGGVGRVGATMMMDLAAAVLTEEEEEGLEGGEEEEARGMNVCVVKGWRSSTSTSSIWWPLDVRRARSKQVKRLRDGLAGAPLGELW